MSESGVIVTSKTVDLTNCDREQIQFVGAIQPHGALLVIEEPELRILQASRNTGDLLGIPADTLVGDNLRSLFSEEQVTGLRSRLLRDNLAGTPVYVARAEFIGRNFDVLAHRQDQVLILELEERREPSSLSWFDIYSELSTAISKLEATVSLRSFLDLAAQEIRLFSGFDRVMIYKFMEDKSGWVLSEALAEGLEPYLDLHYPSSDIPEPARRLFSLTWVRHQPDIRYTPVPILPENNPLTGKPLDLSYALLRSVSIMYVDYLKNMGTRSSLVMTLLKDGKLWGLVACQHHTGAKHVPYEVRAACQFLALTLSLLMSAKEDLENYQYRMKLKSTQLQMVANISRRADFISGLTEESPNLLEFVKARGAATIVNGQIASLGQTPSETEIEQIAQWLSTVVAEHVFATDCLSVFLPQAVSFKDRCAGLLSLRFSETKNDFILWFRPEIIYTVKWAGDPHKPVDLSSDGQRLLPRTSFALWKETVRLKSAPWAEVELEEVKELRVALLELMLRRAEDRRHAERRAAFDHVVDGLLTIDARGNVESFNPACKRIFGYESEEVIGRNIKMLMPEPYHGEHDGYLSRYAATGEAHIIGTAGREVSGRRKDGSTFPMDLSVSVFELEDGKHYSGVIRDITARKAVEAERERIAADLARYTRTLERSNQELDAFAYAASHDLKAPLRVIHNASKWIEEDLAGNLTNAIPENMLLLRSRVRRMDKLLDDLLEYSRIGHETDSIHAEAISGAVLMENIQGLLSPPEGFIVRATSTFAGIEVLRMPLQQILLNLISNAIKHHDKKAGRIEVSVEDLGAMFRFSVKDDGPGIPPQYHEQVFKMFKTLKPRDQVEGSGMGLAMVRKHVDTAGGELTLESSVGHGSTFSFTWPKQQTPRQNTKHRITRVEET